MPLCGDRPPDTAALPAGAAPTTVGSEDGNHVSILEAFGNKLGRSKDETRVTCELAGPARTGGIAISLQQPRHNHPFAQGTEAVIRDCITLQSLEEIFPVVSCNTLDMRRDVTVIDLLPYLPAAENAESGRGHARGDAGEIWHLCSGFLQQKKNLILYSLLDKFGCHVQTTREKIMHASLHAKVMHINLSTKV